jgi:hypothetical protein
MEHLWSPAVATGGNRWQMERPRKRLKKAKTVAVGCDQLPEAFHGKEGVDGSSPSEGFEKSLLFSSFCLRTGRRLGVPASTERPRLAANASCEAWNRWR